MNATKIRILESAKDVLIAEGSTAFSMRKVAERASVRLNNVQYYFKNKADLIDGLLSCYLEESRNDLALNLENCGDGRQGIQTFLKRIFNEEARTEEIKLSIALTSLAEIEEIGDRLDTFYDQYYRLLIDFLHRVAGDKASDDNLQKGASLLLPYINGYGLVSSNLGLNISETTELLTDIVWQLINS